MIDNVMGMMPFSSPLPHALDRPQQQERKWGGWWCERRQLRTLRYPAGMSRLLDATLLTIEASIAGTQIRCQFRAQLPPLGGARPAENCESGKLATGDLAVEPGLPVGQWSAAGKCTACLVALACKGRSTQNVAATIHLGPMLLQLPANGAGLSP